MRLRKLPSFTNGFLIYDVISDNVLSFVRWKKGSDPYLVAINFGHSACTEDYSIELDGEVKVEGERVLSTGSVSETLQTGHRVRLDKLHLCPGDAIVCKLL